VRGDLIIFIIIGAIVLLGRLLKKLGEAGGREARRPPGQVRVPGYEAPPEEIREFLRNLQGARRVEAHAARPPVAQSPAKLPRPVEELEPQAAALEAGLPTEPAPAETTWEPERILERPVETPPVARVRRRRAKPAAKAVVRPAAPPAVQPLREEKAPATPAAPLTAAAGMPVALRRLGLREAVVWSELLGLPVGLRRLRRQPPRGRM